MRLAHGSASQNDLGEIISGNLGTHVEDLNVLALDFGYLLDENSFNLPIDTYLSSSIACFNEGDNYNNIYELTFYIKLFWKLDFLDNRVRFGFGEGISFTSDILRTEFLEAQIKEDRNSCILNYIDISLDFDVGRLINYKLLNDLYIGWALKHRSGVFGLINDVKKGGSNYNTLYIEKQF